MVQIRSGGGGALLAATLLGLSTVAEALREKIPCIEHGKFYRNPNRNEETAWSQAACAEYYLCVEGDVYDFKCSTGLVFDVSRQICDFKSKVDNCDVTAALTTPRPLLSTKEPICPTGESACADATCIPTSLFCDGQVDCYDGSDEGYCDPENDPNAAPHCDYANVSLASVMRLQIISNCYQIEDPLNNGRKTAL